jgi:hypothetical protein
VSLTDDQKQRFQTLFDNTDKLVLIQAVRKHDRALKSLVALTWMDDDGKTHNVLPLAELFDNEEQINEYEAP